MYQPPMGYYGSQPRSQNLPPLYMPPEQRLQNYEQQYMQQQYPQYQQPQQNSGVVWVQGIEGAKSYLLPPNSNAFLMDSEGSYFYLKSTDSAGLPSTKIYKFHEVTEGDMNTAKQQSNLQTENFVTKDELNSNLMEMNKLLQSKFSEYDSFLSSLTQPVKTEGGSKNAK